MEQRNIDDYLDAARAKNPDIKSDRALGHRLGKGDTTVNHYRRRRQFPNDATMISIAEMGGLDPDIALAELNSWRAEGSAKVHYMAIAQKLAASAAIIGFLLVSTPQAQAGTLAVQGNASQNSMYIMENWILYLYAKCLKQLFQKLGYIYMSKTMPSNAT